MKCAQSRPLGQILQGDRLLDVRIHVTAELADPIRIRIGAHRRQGPAAETGAKPVLLRLFRRLVKSDILAKRWARRTRRTAVHTSGEHAEEEPAILTRVALPDSFPTFIDIQHA